MIFTFETKFSSVVLSLLGVFRDDLTSLDEDGDTFKLFYASDLYMRELRQWASAAFACGLIESPRIERM